MAIPRQYNVVAAGSRGPLEVLDGTVWRQLPKIRNVGFVPTSPSEATTEYLDETTETRAGQSGPGNVTYDLTRAPQMKAYRVCRRAFTVGGSVLRFRDWGGIPTTPRETSGTDMLAVTTAGVGTLTGSGANAGTATAPAPKYRPGRMIFPSAAAAGAQVLVIEAVTGQTGLVLSRYGTIGTAASATEPACAVEDDEDIDAVTAAAFGIASPGTLREFEGVVTSLGGYTRGPNNEGQVDQMVVNVTAFPNDQMVVLPPTS